MRARLFILASLLVSAVLQQFLPAWPLFGGMKPPLLAMAAFHHAMRRGRPDAWLAVFAAAILQDGLDMGSFGPALIAFPAIGYITLRVRFNLFIDSPVTQCFFGAAIGLFTALIAVIVYTATGQRELGFGSGLLRLTGATLLGMITLPPMTWLLKRIEQALPKRRVYGWQ